MAAKSLSILTLILGLGACQSTQETNTALGAAAGAAVGAAVADDDDRVEGAVIGGTLGAVAGTLIGRATEPGQCVYRDSYGRRFIAHC